MITSCPECQAVFDPLSGGYSPDARIVCAPCAERMKNEARKADEKSRGSAFPGSIGSVLIGLMSFIVEHRLVFFLLPLMAMAFGLGTAWTAASSQASRERLGAKWIPTVILGLTGAGLGILSLTVRILFGD